MKNEEKNNLISEHALLVAKYTSGEKEVLKRIKEIETILEMTGKEIAALAIKKYKQEYK
ncbi:MAG: hypothetical protein R3B60_05160 [Candidatus Paceibacterota bacterium]